jgi:hypothetical protein
MQARLLGTTEEHGVIRRQYGAWTACALPGKGGAAGGIDGWKGKCILIHSLTDTAGIPLATCTTPANGGERTHVIPLLDGLYIRTGKLDRPQTTQGSGGG